MYIGIFGDSFAAPRQCNTTWVSKLENNYNVENYALSSSGLFYSYQMYKENEHKPYDKIIFFASQINRHWLSSEWRDKLENFHSQDFHFTGQVYNSDIRTKEKYPNFDEESLEFFNKMNFLSRDFNVYFGLNPDIKKLLANLILADVYKDKRCLVLRCFNDTTDNDFCHNEISMSRVSDDWKLEKIEDKRALDNHLLPENHEWFYNKIEKWINSGEFSLTEEDLDDKLR